MKKLKYMEIADGISADIKSKRLAEGERLPGVRELAAEWETSANTVLKALDALVSEGLIRKTQGSGIFVTPRNNLYGNGANTETPSLELIMWDIDVPFNHSLLSAIEKAATDEGFQLSVRTSEQDTQVNPESACIIVPLDAPGQSTNQISKRNTIYLGEFNPAPSFEGSYISVDVYSGFYRAAEYLLAAGRERVAYVGSVSANVRDPGRQAVRDSMQGTSYGFNKQYSVAAEGWDADTGREAMERLLYGDDFPDAVICLNDALAAGVYKACRAAGLSIPDDVAVIGAGDQDVAGFLDPPLTSLKYPSAIMGRMAVSYLKSLERGHINASERLRARLDMELIVRESVQLFSDDAEWL
ncbi:MAG: GntR family transcriptional regulator [Spirochaetales bacterium]|uniref:GntR family transcriptional regulator n=1 Tax=Candidatus Thalassospirochaeta sargassi TaxID=3119039 RepID=A0AAJ1IGG7_9SPIO|nr:GntR family transcriptional regulator [Spirochaetales bacterium]